MDEIFSKIVSLITSPLTGWIVSIGLGIIFKTKLNQALAVISILIDGVEEFDENVKDIITDAQEKKLDTIKEWINGKLTKAGVDKKKIVNKMLEEKGILGSNESPHL